ncbi:MAG TPA: ATP-binding cassette domain-containing protein, partial [Burkholderiales bacterium]|nr:ATP-binding cassette domain-containing protein [Burkholderiales bacterium]
MLEARQIECIRGHRRLFAGLSFRLEPNQALRVGGENGSGKSSLLRMVAGLAPVEAGAMLWNGKRIAEAGEDFRRSIAFIGHA